MKKGCVSALLCLCCLVAFDRAVVSAEDLLAEGTVTVRVVDEDRQALKECAVTIIYDLPKSGDVGSDSKKIYGPSSEEGLFRATWRGYEEITVIAAKDGYYKSKQPYVYASSRMGKWLPEDPTVEVVLRRKVDPVPMYAKGLYNTELPAFETPLGYDLFIGDWVAPFGKGMQSDLTFAASLKMAARDDYSLELSVRMANPGDGFAGIPASQESPQSELVLPRTAYSEAYVPEIVNSRTSRPNEYGAKPSMQKKNMFIRVRTVQDEHGGILRANYGKILGPIDLRVSNDFKTAFVTFVYYVNPEVNSRNVEFDVTKNVFVGLPSTCEVRRP